MTRRTEADVDVALRLLALESGGGSRADDRAAAAVRVYERLADRLEPLIGIAGMRALLARSAKLTKVEFSCFEAIGVGDGSDNPTPSKERLRECFGELDPAVTSAAAAALYGTMLGLLISFIGERLVWQVLRSAFPAFERVVPKEIE
jgi:hypothetical protein